MSITHIIKATGKTRRQICDEADLSSAMLSLIESGDRQVGVGKIEALARALNVPPAVLRPDLAALFAQSAPLRSGPLACDPKGAPPETDCQDSGNNQHREQDDGV